jgi:hypothetical protein
MLILGVQKVRKYPVMQPEGEADMNAESTQLLTGMTELELYHQLIKIGEDQAHRQLSPDLERYLVGILQASGRADEIMAKEPERRLATIYGEAQFAPSVTDRAMTLHELGFEGLKLIGFFPGQLKRRHVTLSYAYRMTKGAYVELSDLDCGRLSRNTFLQTLIPLSQEIAENLDDLVYVLWHTRKPNKATNEWQLHAVMH